jgi:YggT family protein
MSGFLFQIVQLIANAVFGLFTLMLLARFFMQWQRLSFRNQVGAFVQAVTDWMVLPLRRVIPGFCGLDWASLLPAWGAQILLVLVGFMLGDLALGGASALVLGALGLGLIGLCAMIVWLIFFIVMAAAILSWFGPHLPMGFVFDALSRPFLAPFRRVVPLVSGVDLSPLVLLLVLQILQMALGQLGAGFLSWLTGS